MKADRGFENDRWVRISQVVAEHQTKLIRYATSIVRDGDRAKDIVQETFVRLCRANWKEVEGHLQAWLYRVTRNLALDVLRKENRMSFVKDSESLDRLAGAGVVEGELDSRMETARSLLDLASALPPNQSEVVLLKFQQDLSYKEISKITGLSVGNVGYLLHHALKELKSRWQAGQSL